MSSMFDKEISIPAGMGFVVQDGNEKRKTAKIVADRDGIRDIRRQNGTNCGFSNGYIISSPVIIANFGIIALQVSL